jgi:hypothetical protein
MSVITDALGFDNFNINTDFYEQMAASSPVNAQWIFYGANGSPQNAWHTENGGLNWQLNQPAYPGGTCCDPWAVYSATNVLIYGSGVSGQYVYRSTNNGLTWTAPVLSVSGSDRNTIGIEMTGTGPYANYVYAAITSGTSGPFARSTNLGASWTTTYSYTNNLPGVMIAVGPNGATNGGCIIYVTNTQPINNPTYTFHRSLDGGATFSVMSSLTVAGVVGVFNAVSRHTINNARTRPYPWIAMDNSNGPYRGRVYLVYASNVPAGSGNKPDIKLQWSSDQGATWSAYVVVNDNPNPTLSDQWQPSIYCEPTTGKLYVNWYDDRSNGTTFQTDRYGTYSTTGGTTFATNQRLTNATWTFPCPGCAANSNCYKGDYEGTTANPITSFTVWSDHRNCSAISMGGYFPDFGMRVLPAVLNITNINDSAFSYVAVPAVKLYTSTATFTTSVSPPPGAGTITISLLNRITGVPQTTLSSYPDSLRLRARATGGVTPGVYTITIEGRGPNGTPAHRRTVTLNVGPAGIISQGGIPDKYYLYQNYPNPFNPATTIRFDLAKQGSVKLNVYDITGELVATIADGNYGSGKYMADFDGVNLSSGIYFYKLETDEYTAMRKMMLIK